MRRKPGRSASVGRAEVCVHCPQDDAGKSLCLLHLALSQDDTFG